VSTTDGTSWAARAVVVTVPLGGLPAEPPAPGAITFAPVLREKRALWRSLGYGHALAVVLRFRPGVGRSRLVPGPLRGRDGCPCGFLHTGAEAFSVWWPSPPAPVLTGWTGGPAAQALAACPPQEIHRLSVASLARHWRCPEARIARALAGWHVHNWTLDPFARGAYSFAHARFPRAPEQLAAPVGGVLFFAGEATAAVPELGTVHGAMASGIRVAQEVRSHLRPAADTSVTSGRRRRETLPRFKRRGIA
jgi:monoamine oxidase